MDVRHIIVTRFNMGRGNDAQWTRDRAKLLHQYAACGVTNQTFRDFDWVILVDETTPAILLEETIGNLPAHYVRVPYWKEVKEWLHPFAEWCQSHVKTEWLATTRLDSDDVLHPQYMADIDAAVLPTEETLAFRGGYTIFTETGVVYSMLRADTNFQTLVELTTTARTAYCVKHDEMRRKFAHRTLPQFPRWLVVRHGNNWHYDRKGRRAAPRLPQVSAAQYKKEFGFLEKGE